MPSTTPLTERCVECGVVTAAWVYGWDDQYRCINDAPRGPRISTRRRRTAQPGVKVCPTCGGSGKVRR